MSKLSYSGQGSSYCKCNLCGMFHFDNEECKVAEKSATPITPESLEAIGFKHLDDLKDIISIEIRKRIDLRFYIPTKTFEFWMLERCQIIDFDSTEQIVEWIKPFQTKVGE